MLNGYERGLVLTFLSRGLPYLRRHRCPVCEVGEWLKRYAYVLAIGELTDCVQSWVWDEEPSPEAWMTVEEVIERARPGEQDLPPDLLLQRLRALGENVGLSPLDVTLLETVVRYDTQPVIGELFRSFSRAIHDRERVNSSRSRALACLVGITTGQMQERFCDFAPLVRGGLVTVQHDGDLYLLSRLNRVASPRSGRPEEEDDVRRLLFGGNATTDLEWSDFDHLGQARDDVAGLVRSATLGGQRGVNILLYGPSGTGKTEFARVLAKHAGADLLCVGEAEGGEEPSRRERLRELCLAQSVLAHGSRSVLLVDEMEDLISGVNHSWLPNARGVYARQDWAGYSKVFMHRLLEEAPVPTVWTTNGAGDMDTALLRRMTFAMEMRQPPPRVRARIWSRQLASRGIEATDAQALALARDFDASPGVAAGAVAAAAISNGDIELVRRGVRGLSRLLGRERPRGGVGEVDPRLLHADVNLAALADRLTERGARRFSICLQGPPGDGQKRLCAPPGRLSGSRCSEETQFGPTRHVRWGNGGEHCPGFRQRPRRRGLPALWRSRLAAR